MAAKIWEELKYDELAIDQVWICNLCTKTHNAYANATALLLHLNSTPDEHMPIKKKNKFTRPNMPETYDKCMN